MKEKIIKDLVHGYIKVNPNIERVIDHSSFQRLKGISQLTAHHLYPSANHTRFEHSLGVMHLAMKFFDQLENDINKNLDPSVNAIAYINRLRENLRYAALLHDVGHAPFSHLGESFFDAKDVLLGDIKKIIPETTDDIIEHGSKHEIMSCLIIAKKFKQVFDTIDELKDVIDYDFIFRIITGTKYDSLEKWAEDLSINLINSSSVDVDKLDYLLRDNFMTGNIAPIIDINRLIMSLAIDSEKKICYKPLGISSLINLIDSRDFLYLWVYNHHTVVYTDYLYGEAIKHLSNLNNKKTLENNKIRLDEFFFSECHC